MLGNLYREKGQVGRAIQEHQALLQRPRLNRIEHANVLLCLGPRLPPRRLRRSRGRGVLGRAEARPQQRGRAGQPREAAGRPAPVAGGVRHAQRLAQIAGPPDQPQSQSILAFLENELGLQALKAGRPGRSGAPVRGGDRARPHASSRRICTSATCARSRATSPGAVAIWERSIDVAPDRAYLALDRLERAYADARRGTAVRRAVPAAHAASPREWRARAALARHLSAARPAARRRSNCCSKRSSTTRTRSRSTRRSGTRSRRSTCRGIWSRATSRSRASRCSTSTRTSACGAGTAAPSCSGSARTATSGTRSSKSASRRPPTPKPRSPPASAT